MYVPVQLPDGLQSTQTEATDCTVLTPSAMDGTHALAASSKRLRRFGPRAGAHDAHPSVVIYCMHLLACAELTLDCLDRV